MAGSEPRIHIQITSGSWFSTIERQAIDRGNFPAVRDLMIKIREFINGWNNRYHPFLWTKPARRVIDTIKG